MTSYLLTAISRFGSGEDKMMFPGAAARNGVAFNCYTGVCRRRCRVSRSVRRVAKKHNIQLKPGCVRAGNSACCRLLIARMALAKPLITHERVISHPPSRSEKDIGPYCRACRDAALAAGHNEGPSITPRALRDRMKLLRRPESGTPGTPSS